MPHTTNWIVDQRVLYTRFSGKINQQELENFISTVLETIKTGTPMVHHISNSLEMEKVEISLKTLQTLIGGYKLVSALGWQVDINRNPLNRMLANFGSQFSRTRARTFDTLDEGIAFLKQHDETLVDAHWKIDKTIIPDHADIQVRK